VRNDKQQQGEQSGAADGGAAVGAVSPASPQQWPSPSDERKTARARIRGLYLITPDCDDTGRLVRQVEAALGAGARLFQYRNKTAAPARRREQVAELLDRCRASDALLVVNDDWRLAMDLGADALHLGRDDGDVADVRRQVGADILIGVSCYADLDRAALLAPSADYLAFGAMFVSATKPQAPPAPLAILREARRFGLPVVAIGGIDRKTLPAVLASGADAGALISAVFGAADVGRATRELLLSVTATLGAAESRR
jgi:thiamine-phosphate pyrophosphorylase